MFEGKSVMEKQLALIFVILGTLFIYAKSNKPNEELVTYKNKNGFEITYKKCQKLEATNSYEYDVKDLSSLENIVFHSSCETDVKRFVSFGPSGENYKTKDELNNTYENFYKKSIKFSKEKGSSSLYIPEKKYLIENNLLLVVVTRFTSGYRWYIKKQCGIIVHALEINVHIPHSKEYEAKITSGEEIIPPEEKKIIDSFKCVEQVKK